jgi:acetolactate synthase-1/2/3 large subunit
MPRPLASIADVLARSGARRVFAVAAASGSLREVFGPAGVDVVEVGSPDTAVLLAAVAAEVDDRAGIAFVPDAELKHARSALAYARLDRAPVVVLAAGVAPGAPWRPLFKAGTSSGADAGEAVALASATALRDPRGPVRLDLPEATTTSKGDTAHAAVTPVDAASSAPGAAVDPAALERAVSLITTASRPIVVAGLACRWGDAASWIRPFVESLPAPVWLTLKAKGVLPDPHPLALGVMAGDVEAPGLLARADLVITVGVDPVEGGRELWPRGVRVLELAPAGTPLPEDGLRSAVAGDVGLVLAELAPRIRGASRADWDVAELDRFKRGTAGRAGDDLTPLGVARLAREMTEAGAIATVDPGSHTSGVIRGWHAVAPREFLASATVAPPGFAVAAAVAARLARPASAALAFTTGVALAAGNPALDVAVRRALPVVVLAFGAVPPQAPTGVRRLRAGTARELTDALAAALAAGAPALVEVAPV